MSACLAFLVTAFLSSSIVTAAPFENIGGGNIAVAGHSYFKWIALQFDAVASAHPSLFPNHTFTDVFRGGENGAPGALWRDTKYEVETMLVNKDIQLFALTAHNQDSDLQDYKNWFDLALLYNSATQFLISVPWAGDSPGMDTADFEALNIAGCDAMWAIVQQLRTDYPNNAVHMLCHSFVAHNLKARFEAGNLPDVSVLVGDDTTGLYTDNFGHGGDYMEHLMGLLWMDWLYGVPSGSSLADMSIAAGSNYDSTILTQVTDEVLTENAAYRLSDTYPTEPVPGPGNPDYGPDGPGGPGKGCFSKLFSLFSHFWGLA